jgi:hydrogenase maturation factor
MATINRRAAADTMASIPEERVAVEQLTGQLRDAAVENEQRLATALDEPDATVATGRARALVDATRRGLRLHVRPGRDRLRQGRRCHIHARLRAWLSHPRP